MVGGKCGFIDLNGALIVKPHFAWLGILAEGLALYNQDWKFGYMDKTGRIVIPARFLDAHNFSQGRALVRLPYNEAKKLGAKFAFINRQGKVVIPQAIAEDDPAPHFSEGLAPVMAEGKFGFADRTGKLVIPASFSEAHNFAEGLAPVGAGRKTGYIDKTGKFVWQAQD